MATVEQWEAPNPEASFALVAALVECLVPFPDRPLSPGQSWGAKEQGYQYVARGADSITQNHAWTWTEPAALAELADGATFESAYHLIEQPLGADSHRSWRWNALFSKRVVAFSLTKGRVVSSRHTTFRERVVDSKRTVVRGPDGNASAIDASRGVKIPPRQAQCDPQTEGEPVAAHQRGGVRVGLRTAQHHMSCIRKPNQSPPSIRWADSFSQSTGTWYPSASSEYPVLPPGGRETALRDKDPSPQRSGAACGNMTSDATFAYTWNGENRLVKVAPKSAAENDLRLSFTYPVIPPGERETGLRDYPPRWLRRTGMGRRVQKVVEKYEGSAWSTNAVTKFVWDGWLLVAELDGLDSDALDRTYTWGADFREPTRGPAASVAS